MMKLFRFTYLNTYLAGKEGGKDKQPDSTEEEIPKAV